MKINFKLMGKKQKGDLENYSKMEYKTHQKAILITSMEIIRFTVEKMDRIEWSEFQKNIEVVKSGLDLVLTEMFDEITKQKKEILS